MTFHRMDAELDTGADPRAGGDPARRRAFLGRARAASSPTSSAASCRSRSSASRRAIPATRRTSRGDLPVVLRAGVRRDRLEPPRRRGRAPGARLAVRRQARRRAGRADRARRRAGARPARLARAGRRARRSSAATARSGSWSPSPSRVQAWSSRSSRPGLPGSTPTPAGDPLHRGVPLGGGGRDRADAPARSAERGVGRLPTPQGRGRVPEGAALRRRDRGPAPGREGRPHVRHLRLDDREGRRGPHQGPPYRRARRLRGPPGAARRRAPGCRWTA